MKLSDNKEFSHKRPRPRFFSNIRLEWNEAEWSRSRRNWVCSARCAPFGRYRAPRTGSRIGARFLSTIALPKRVGEKSTTPPRLDEKNASYRTRSNRARFLLADAKRGADVTSIWATKGDETTRTCRHDDDLSSLIWGQPPSLAHASELLTPFIPTQSGSLKGHSDWVTQIATTPQVPNMSHATSRSSSGISNEKGATRPQSLRLRPRHLVGRPIRSLKFVGLEASPSRPTIAKSYGKKKIGDIPYIYIFFLYMKTATASESSAWDSRRISPIRSSYRAAGTKSSKWKK